MLVQYRQNGSGKNGETIGTPKVEDLLRVTLYIHTLEIIVHRGWFSWSSSQVVIW